MNFKIIYPLVLSHLVSAYLVVGSETIQYEIPRLAKVAIDGEVSDWQGNGLQINAIVDRGLSIRESGSFGATARLGWDRKGLLFYIAVVDDRPDEGEGAEEVRISDHVRIQAGPVDAPKKVRDVRISPGVAEGATEATSYFRKGGAKLDLSRRKTESGYDLELRWPWKELGIEPKPGVSCFFALSVRNSDPGERDDRIEWWVVKASGDPMPFHRLVLASEASPNVNAVATARYRGLREADIEILVPGELAGQAMEVKDAGGATIISTTLKEEKEGWVRMFQTMRIRNLKPPSNPLSIVVGSKPLCRFFLPDYEEEKVWALFNEPFLFHHYSHLFWGDTFPKGDFENPFMVEQLIGPYSLEFRYFDSTFNEVSEPSGRGRYGVIATIATDQHPPFRRFGTLYRHPKGFRHWNQWRPDWNIKLPEEYGIDPLVLGEHQEEVGWSFRWIFLDSLRRTPEIAVLLSALREREPRAQLSLTMRDPVTANRQWWVDLERHLRGEEKPVLPPIPSKRKNPAPALRTGSATEAGVGEAEVDAIDRFLKSWAEDSNEGFSVCLARNGVIFLHEAYGRRRGRPMKTSDPNYLASISKLLGGAAFMMLVDRGLVELDDPVSRFVPELEWPSDGPEMTIRHLFTHTSGMRQHSGVYEVDLVERLARVAPHLRIGSTYHYNGTDNELAGKIIERLTGEALPAFFERHLLGPLGCRNSVFSSMSWKSYAAAEDLARIAQMLLNKGSYGEWQFISEKSYEQFLPSSIEPLIAHATDIVYGIGTTPYYGSGLGRGTFGHGAASSTILRIDPEHQLIIVMTRNNRGSNFHKYHERFIEMVTESVE